MTRNHHIIETARELGLIRGNGGRVGKLHWNRQHCLRDFMKSPYNDADVHESNPIRPENRRPAINRRTRHDRLPLAEFLIGNCFGKYVRSCF